MARGPNASLLLARALIAGARRAGCPVCVEALTASAWRSATFTGATHSVILTADASPGLAAWLGGIDEADFAIAGHLVADITVDSVAAIDGRCRVTMGALTLVEA